MKLKLENGEYEGEVVNGKMHGVGILTYYGNSGKKYFGQFENNVYNGYGQLTFSNGEYYKGFWKNGLRHNKGFLQLKDFYYAGDFEDGAITGSGYMKLKNGTIILGNWQNGLLIGHCSFYYPDKSAMHKYYKEPGKDAVVNAKVDKYNEQQLEAEIKNAKQLVTNTVKESVNYIAKQSETLFPQKTHQTNDTQNAQSKTTSTTTKNTTTTTTETAKSTTQPKENTPEKIDEQIIADNKQSIKFYKLIKKANKAFRKENFFKSLNLYEKAIKFAPTIDSENTCKFFIIISRIYLNTKYNNSHDLLKDLEAAKALYGQYPNIVNDTIKNYIENQISFIRAQIEDVDKFQDEFSLACDYAINSNYAKAIEMFKSIKSRAKTSTIKDQCDDNISKCQQQLENELQNEKAKPFFDKAVECAEKGNYDQAIEYFHQAKQLFIDNDSIATCEKNISICEDAIESIKQREREEKAIKYYKAGLEDYEADEFYDARIKFEHARELTHNQQLILECNNLIDSCIELEP